ncbi:MAG: adenylyltransferase/cytidyltransferase family protein [Alistipes sp.]|nr:adenylyltransferase/cytidyltransferase family protein [Alistipes senegalensis]MCM1251179.1 adenylyltransferase/cytidyltransferase family protein [Alistipes sp.]
MMKRTMLYFGSFDPVHRGHIALAEYVVEHDLADETVLVVSPQSPYKTGRLQAPETDRFEMAEIACAASKYPERIKPSAIEFLLPRPSYTIDTLRHLEELCGRERKFSILMGGDQIAALDGWKEYEKVLEYPIYVYPRRGERVERWLDRIEVLEDAPLQDFSSTQVRAAIERGDDTSRMLVPGVADYIRRKGLWSPAYRKAALDGALTADPENVGLLLERGQLHYRLNEWGAALNDFNAVLRRDPARREAQQFIDMIQEILAFRYKDIYNP